MLRPFLLAGVLFCIVSWAPVSTVQAQHVTRLERVRILPPDQLSPIDDIYAAYRTFEARTRADFQNKLDKLHEYQTDLENAGEIGDEESSRIVLAQAMTDLADVMTYEDAQDEPRVREAYRAFISEYERQYGTSDTVLVAIGDIFDIRAELFSVLEETENPLREEDLPIELTPVETTIPMTINRLVESTINSLLKEPERHLIHWLSRADTYLPMIERIFREVGIPDELKYLAMIESGLNPKAASWARAVGMWQFVAATGRAYGLELNSWVDDRMDPEKATRAAALHLKDLHARYGDWLIAMAGYNCSPRCIKRAIRNAKSAGAAHPTYWDMYRYLPRETRGYIPMFIATALITSNPSAFSLPPVEPGPAYEYHLVPVQGMLSLKDLAEMAGSDVTTMKRLNPNLKRSTLPPSTGAFYLRIPAGSYASFTAAYDALPESAKRPSGEYIVKKGDTLGHIGQRYGVSVSRLMQKNGLRSTRIGIGLRLVVPLVNYSSAPIEGLAEASDAIIQYGQRSTRPIVSSVLAERRAASQSETPITLASLSNAPSNEPNQSPPDDTAGKSRIVYEIRRGDTLGRIASRYGVSISQLQSWNNLSGTRIRTGRRLSIFSDAEPTADSREPIVYRVRQGDTLSEIAEAHDVRLSQLRRWNNISGSRIRVGQRLTIRLNSNVESVIHTVRKGDTLIEIAGRYAVTVAKIKDWNNLRSNTIRIGKQLKIYR